MFGDVIYTDTVHGVTGKFSKPAEALEDAANILAAAKQKTAATGAAHGYVASEMVKYNVLVVSVSHTLEKESDQFYATVLAELELREYARG